MIQIENGTWSIPIAPQGAVERSYGSRKLDLNVAYAVDIKSITFPFKKGADVNNPQSPRIGLVDLVVVEAGFEGIEREINMPLPQQIPQGADDKTLRSLLFAHELWFNLLLSIGYNDPAARQIIGTTGITAAVIANAPGRGRAYMHVGEDEYLAVVKDPVSKQPVIDMATGAAKTEKRMGEERALCSPTWYQNNSAAARRKTIGGQPNAGNAQPGGFQPGNAVPPGMVAGPGGVPGQPSYSAPVTAAPPVAQVPAGGFAAPGGAPASPFTGVPNGGFAGGPGSGAPPVSGPMATLTAPRAQ